MAGARHSVALMLFRSAIVMSAIPMSATEWRAPGHES